MLSNKVFYHGTIKKAISVFERLFSSIYIERKVDDSVNGTTIQTLHIPIAFAQKEKEISILEQNPELKNNVYISLPRMSFEILGYNYDAKRKLPKLNKITCNQGTSNSKSVYTPSPWNLDISLYILTKNSEDAFQILEQILPTFVPEYTISINSIPEMNLIQDIPVILNSVSVSDEYDGSPETHRFVTHTLNFTLKLNLFGGIGNQGIIEHVTTNLSNNKDMSDPFAIYKADGDPNTGNITESWQENT